MGAFDLFPWWVRWVGPVITVVLGLAVLAVGSEVIWRSAARAMGRRNGMHWSERARHWITWRAVAAGWHLAMLVGICVADLVVATGVTIASTLRLAVVAAVLSLVLLARRNFGWLQRCTGMPRPRSTWRASLGFHAIFLRPLWIALLFGTAVPARYDARGIAWAILLLLSLLLSATRAGNRLLLITGIFKPARKHVVAAVESARRSLPVPGPEVRVFEVELGHANAIAYPGSGMIAFTVAAVEALTPEQLAAIGAHELEHLQESRAARALRAAWCMAYGLPVLLVPALPHAPANGLLLGICLFFVCALAYRSLSVRLEKRADHAATVHGQDSAVYALALERLYELNLVPAVTRVQQTHPHLYDRLIAAGHPPTFPRPRPPSLWPSVVSPLLVLVCSAGVVVTQIVLTTVLATRLDLGNEAQRAWAVALEGKRADWLTIAAQWIEQERFRDASLALSLVDDDDEVPALMLRAAVAAHQRDCDRATELLDIAGLAECAPRSCLSKLRETRGGRSPAVVLEYSRLLQVCQPD